ncbi:menaquinone-dependent protoporphyrinogen IX oxidase [Halanaerobium saccharolyticum]|uniref:Menaquinone-dependent protoporphyrinogen IX oxidase n=1 Tax=Halanaerobium saccharolyticum TaxID=43595 RepID=A0A4R7ZBW0_9FIRM|nr:flavodoxin domain-containing protein [Halanaerobium saccharolyticum]RAK11902.1 menaquinone-dependent protoporphyrinogen IX oxidase [Halanaerobium saccharolyticum]TDW07743.1 menaquinone-dependent protoporphyrinogen IX oxidase [Halanaerobium saccharolyticum]TDX64664.1 menaquinone-dependent protoporphyrinogen IX oxidase [Halanaerobium saccharolyticum]
MKTLIVYWSKTGFVKKYAKWLAEELEADIISGEEITEDKLKEYDGYIFGGSLYAVGINGADFIKENIKHLEAKKTAVFATGASPAKKEIIEEVKNKNFSPEEQKCFKFFYLRGGFDYSKLGFKDKVLMSIMKWKLNSKKKKGEEMTAEEKGMLAAFDNPVDFTDKENIEEIISYFKE